MLVKESIIALEYSVVAYANYYQFEPSMVINNVDVCSRMLLWCESGAGEVTSNGDKYSFSKGRYLFLPWKHSITYRADAISPFRLGGVHLIPYYSPNLPFKARVAHNRQEIWWEGDSIRDEDIPYAKEIISGRFNTKTTGLEHLARHTIEVFLRECYRRQSAHSLASLLFEEMQYLVKNVSIDLKDSLSSPFDTITGYIRDNLENEISLQQLCSVGAVSLSTLRRLFLKSVGASPYEWILQVRLEKARRLLKTTPDPISTIAINTGFGDPSYFIRLFHKREGLTPYQYRKQAFKI